ncbi:MAG TPA: 4Fe-4S dicluster domain-containing protein [bacterium]|jgi:heterodisulfide reductase subunit C
MAEKTFTEPAVKTEAELRASFWQQVKSIPHGEKLKECIQCGTCTGSCPVSYIMDTTPRQNVALLRAGRIEDILQSRSIWLCASCYSCTVRCPAEIKITDMMYALKRLAMEKKIYPEKFPVYALSKAFIDNVYKYGRNYEMGLGIRYLLKVSPLKLAGSAGFGIAMMSRGRLGVLPKTIKKVDEVRAIIDRAKQLGEH